MFGMDKHVMFQYSSKEKDLNFTHYPTTSTLPLEFKYGHLHLNWAKNMCSLLVKKIGKPHTRFAHLLTPALIDFLKENLQKMLKNQQEKK